MAKQQFTPGPWYITQSEAGAPRYIREEASDVVLAYVEDGGHVDPQFALPEDEQIANGRLMAAAPDLHAALHQLASILEAVRDDSTSARMGFGASAAEKKERVRVLTGYIETNAEKLDEALAVAITALAKAPAPAKQFETA